MYERVAWWFLFLLKHSEPSWSPSYATLTSLDRLLPTPSKKGAVHDQSTVFLCMPCSHFNKFMFHVHDYLIIISFSAVFQHTRKAWIFSFLRLCRGGWWKLWLVVFFQLAKWIPVQNTGACRSVLLSQTASTVWAMKVRNICLNSSHDSN